MAAVYAARDERLDRPVAVKVLADNLAAHADIRERFVREGQIAAGLSHPHVVDVYDAGEDGTPYIVMELIDGPTLAEELRRRGRLSVKETAVLGAQVADGLAYAHGQGIVHRDIKPENLILLNGQVKIADFGIAHAVEATRLTEIGTVMGTAAYLAPEQATGGQVTPATDVYALGSVLYELLTGRPPHEATTLTELLAGELYRPVPPLATLEPSIPRSVDLLVERCLAADPVLRPSAEDVREVLRGDPTALTEILRPLPAQRQPRLPRSARERRRWLVVLAIAAVAGAISLGVAAWLGGGSPGSSNRPSGGSAPVARVSPVPRGATPAQDARNLARWLRRYSGASSR
jgi:serine/threonine-protein kinase